MTSSERPASGDEHEDQDAEPASTPTGAAAEGGSEEDQDAGPASEPEPS